MTIDQSTFDKKNDAAKTIRIISASNHKKKNILHETYSYLKWVYQTRGFIKVITDLELKRSIVQTKLSYVWWVLDPLLNFLCYLFLVSLLARNSVSNMEIPYPLLIISALFPWHFTMKTLTNSASVWDKYSTLIGQIRFPYINLLISILAYDLILYLISLFVVFFVCFFYGYYPTWCWFYLPLIILLQGMFSFGLMLMNSLISFTFYDYQKLLPFILRIWFFVSPAIWSLDMLPDRLQTIAYLNPLTFLFENYRSVLLNNLSPNWSHIEIFFVFSLCLISVGLILFIRREPYINRYI